jgi:protein SCO1
VAGAARGCEIMRGMSRAKYLSFAVVLAVSAAFAGAWFAARQAAPEPPEHARLLSTPRPLPDLPITDHEGRPFGLAGFHGHWSLAFFGFTHCPDICPATLQVLAGARRLLDDLPPEDRPGVVMISLDPGRDTPARLAEYVPFFDPEFRGLSVAAADLPELTRAFGAAYAYSPLGEDSYTVDHTSSVFLVDRDGRVAAVFPTPHTAENIAADMRRIIALENTR